MIKTNELRAGNWVFANSTGVIEVKSVDSADAGTINGNLSLHMPKPIPLSVEIFERCGFDQTVYQNFDKSFNHENLHFSFYSNEDEYFPCLLENGATTKVSGVNIFLCAPTSKYIFCVSWRRVSSRIIKLRHSNNTSSE